MMTSGCDVAVDGLVCFAGDAGADLDCDMYMHIERDMHTNIERYMCIHIERGQFYLAPR